MTDVLPRCPIFTSEDVITFQDIYLASADYRAVVLVMVALADPMDPIHDRDIIDLYFSGLYPRTLQCHALLALYWNYRGRHYQAKVHINEAFRLAWTFR